MHQFDNFLELLSENEFEASMPDRKDYDCNSKLYRQIMCTETEFMTLFENKNFEWFTLCRGIDQEKNREFIEGIVRIIIKDQVFRDYEHCLRTIDNVQHLLNIIRFIACEEGITTYIRHDHRIVYKQNWLHASKLSCERGSILDEITEYFYQGDVPY